MTNEQKQTISAIYERYLKNCQQYSSFDTSDYCSFTCLKDEVKKEDDNIVVILSEIEGLDNFGIPETTITNFLIEPNGKFYQMDMMPDVFMNNNEIISYIQTLTKFDFNAQ